METAGFRWQHIRDIVLRIMPPEGAMGNFKISYPYQYGIIYVEVLFGSTLSRFPSSILVSIQHIQMGYFPVLQIEARPTEHIVTLFKDGKWVEVLAKAAEEATNLRTRKLLAQVTEEDRKYTGRINDCYLFPEYIGRGFDLTLYPSNQIEEKARSVVQTLGKYWKDYRHVEGTGEYQDDRLYIKLLRGATARTRVYISPPAQMKEPIWRPVFAIDLRGSVRKTMMFKPGKWIFHMCDLAQIT